jgi:AMMECR1 domain-containing protein
MAEENNEEVPTEEVEEEEVEEVEVEMSVLDALKEVSKRTQWTQVSCCCFLRAGATHRFGVISYWVTIIS